MGRHPRRGCLPLPGRGVRTRRSRDVDEGDLLARRWRRRRCRDALDRDARLRTPEGPGGALGGPGPRVRPSRRPGLLFPRGKPPRRTRGDLDRDEFRRGGPRGREGRDTRPRNGAPRRAGPVTGLLSRRRWRPGRLGQRRRCPGSTASMAGAGAPSTPDLPSVPKTRRFSLPSTAKRSRRSSGSVRRSRDCGRFSKGRWTALGVAQGLPSDSVLSLLTTRGEAARTVWVGTRGGGLAEIVGDRVVAVYDRDSGLPNNNILSLAEVHRPNGRRELWVGTRGGVARRTLDDPRASWSILSAEGSPPLPNDNVFLVAPGRDGRVYLGTNRGVARLSQSAGGADPWEAVTFGSERRPPERRVQPGQPRRLGRPGLGRHECGGCRPRSGPDPGPFRGPAPARRRACRGVRRGAAGRRRATPVP